MVRLSDADERLDHQLPEPHGVVAIEHHHWRESFFWEAHGPDLSSDKLIIPVAVFPTRNLVYAIAMGRVGGRPILAYQDRPYDADPAPYAGRFRVEITEPYRHMRISLPETDGAALDLEFTARTRPVGLRRGRLLADDGSLLWDQSHMIQSGVWSGTYRFGDVSGSVDGWVGQRDHSWGVRDHARIPLWTWFAIQLPDGMLGVWHWELANGARVYTDGAFAPADFSDPVPVIDFHHELHWTDADGAEVPYGADGAGVAGLAGRLRVTLEGGRTLTVDAQGVWALPYFPNAGGGLVHMLVETDDGRTGTAIYEVTGRHHHRYFPTPVEATGH
ncbi:MAG: hypothetical protein MUF83_03895 [Acidimicrobiales bacterium]|nr:hypothetical protein [Acidimicrobiales bacterium]